MTATTTSRIARIGYRKIQHYAGARPTRVTWAGVFERQDGVRGDCGHTGHRTPDAATRCVQRIDRGER